LMLDGKQWLTYGGSAKTGSQWSELTTHKSNEYIPRPVTNYLFDAYQTLKAYLLQQQPRSTVYPNSDNYADKMAAQISELVAECNWEKLKEEQNYEYAASTALVYGTAFKKDYWDTSSIQIAKVPKMEEQPITDPASGSVIGMENKEVIDPETGEVVFEELPLGDVNTAIVEPYKMVLDPISNDIHNCRWIMEYNILSLDIVKQLYKKEGKGFTGEAENIKPETTLSSSLKRFYQLKTSSGVGSDNNTQRVNSSGGSSGMIENAVVLKEYYEAPTKKYTKGRLIVVAGGKLLFVGDSPYQGTELGDWHPYSEFRWEVVPGRFWGKSPLDAAVELQKRINSIDATIILTRKTMAIPQKLNPKGSGLKNNEWTGRPGQMIDYRAVGGAKPEVVGSQGVHPQVFQERAEARESMKEITGAVDILKGEKPGSVTAASALEMLYEVATGKLKPVLDRWTKFIESSQKKQLVLVANKYKEPREDFINKLHAKNKQLPKEMIDNFIGRDLYDNCNITIEAGSSVPKLQSVKKAQLMQMANTGALQLEIPENRVQFLKDMGQVGYDKAVSPDINRAEWENDVLDNVDKEPDTVPVMLNIDDHKVHIEIHGRRMKEPSFLSASSEVQQAFMAHMEEHEQFLQNQQQMQQMEAAMSGQPIPPPMDSNQPVDLDSSGKGIPANLQEQIMGSDIPPGTKASG